jgi:hypothetical protein
MTVAELIKSAYANIGVTDLEGEPTAAQYELAIRSLNSLLGAWSRSRMTIYGLVDESFPLVAGQAAYTVGASQDFDTAWAYQIESAFLRDSNDLDYPLQLVSPDQYEAVALKTQSARPQSLLYNPKGYPLATATLYPVPDQVYTLHWTAQKVLASFTAGEDTVGIAPEFEEALEYNLAIRLAPKFGVPVSTELAALARTTKSAIPMAVEPAVFGGAFTTNGRYSIYSDTI